MRENVKTATITPVIFKMPQQHITHRHTNHYTFLGQKCVRMCVNFCCRRICLACVLAPKSITTARPGHLGQHIGNNDRNLYGVQWREALLVLK